METIRCPGCTTELDPGATSCPVCLRPRSRKEIIQALQKPKQAQRSRRRWLGIVGFLGLLAAAALMKKQQQPAPGPSSAQAPAVSASTETAVAPVVAAAATPAPERPPVRLPPDRRANAAPAPPQRPSGWVISGQVYDLFSLKPVPRALLRFEDASGRVFKTTAGPRGRYNAELPKPADGGYTISVRKDGYKPGYLEEGEPPYRAQSEGRRQDAAIEAAQTTVLHVPVVAGDDGQVRQDLVLIPAD